MVLSHGDSPHCHGRIRKNITQKTNNKKQRPALYHVGHANGQGLHRRLSSKQIKAEDIIWGKHHGHLRALPQCHVPFSRGRWWLSYQSCNKAGDFLWGLALGEWAPLEWFSCEETSMRLAISWVGWHRSTHENTEDMAFTNTL